VLCFDCADDTALVLIGAVISLCGIAIVYIALSTWKVKSTELFKETA